MKKSIFSLILVLVLAFSVFSAAAETVLGEIYVRKGGGTLNLRASQSTSSDSLGFVQHGETVEVLSLGDEWSWIYVPSLEKDGYIKTKYIINIETLTEEEPLPYVIIYPVSDLVAGYEAPSEFSVDLNDDGVMDDMLVDCVSVPGEMEQTVVTAHVDESFHSVALGIASAARAYFVKPQENGEVYCLVSGDACSDDYVTYALTWKNDAIQTLPVISSLADEVYDCAPGAVISIMDGRITLASHIDVLGTWTGIQDYSLINGTLTDISEGFVVIENDISDAETWKYRGMTTKRELTATVNNEAIALPAGTKLLPISVDYNLNEVTFVTDSGISGTFSVSFDEESWQRFVNGIPEEECFETLFYAG